QQVSVPPQTLPFIGAADADAILATGGASVGARVDLRHLGPSGLPRIAATAGSQIHLLFLAGGEQRVDLRSANVWVPGVGVDLLDVDLLAQIQQHATAGGADEEEVSRGIIGMAGQLTVDEAGAGGAVAVDRAA